MDRKSNLRDGGCYHFVVEEVKVRSRRVRNSGMLGCEWAEMFLR